VWLVSEVSTAWGPPHHEEILQDLYGKPVLQSVPGHFASSTELFEVRRFDPPARSSGGRRPADDVHLKNISASKGGGGRAGAKL